MNKNEKPHNPSAYPMSSYGIERGMMDTGEDHKGMTLRDYFANSAMQGIMANSDPELKADLAKLENPYEFLSKEVYKIAEAILKQREQ